MELDIDNFGVNNDLLSLKGESYYAGINDVIKYIVVFVLPTLCYGLVFSIIIEIGQLFVKYRA